MLGGSALLASLANPRDTKCMFNCSKFYLQNVTTFHIGVQIIKPRLILYRFEISLCLSNWPVMIDGKISTYKNHYYLMEK